MERKLATSGAPIHLATATGVGRRALIALLGAAVTWPLAARAQRRNLPTVGLFVAGTRADHSHWVTAFAQRMRELGWVEGHTITLEYRWVDGRTERVAGIVTEFVRLKVDAIVTHSNALVSAAKQGTSAIPIVFAAAGDPVGTGLVASLAQPGGNVTGLSLQQTDTAGKRLELLREVVPDLRRVAIMANVGNSAARLEMADAQAAARKLGIEVATSEIQQVVDIEPAFEALKRETGALYVCN